MVPMDVGTELLHIGGVGMSGKIILMEPDQSSPPKNSNNNTLDVVGVPLGQTSADSLNDYPDGNLMTGEGSLEIDELYREARDGLEGSAVNRSRQPSAADGHQREGWDNKIQFLLSVIGYAVGLGNVWRFPYLCQQHGGGAFLFPYFIMMVLEGMPVFLIEMGIGQRLRVGSIGVWNTIHPYLGGVGVAGAVVSFLVALYYNVIITWCLFYLFNSFQSPLPWAKCPTITVNETTKFVEECEKSSETAYFWYREAVDTTSNIDDLGGLNWKLTLCLIAAWLIVWVCVMKGIKTSGKVMYITATFPYVITTVFLIRAVMLPGADRGIGYMFTPDIHQLLDPRTWLDAAGQIFYSMGLAFGGLIAFSSYNPPKNNVRRDVIILSIANLFTSMYTAVVIFAILGYKGHLNFNKCIDKNLDLLTVYNQEAFPNLTSTWSEEMKDEMREKFVAYERFNFTDTPDFKPLQGHIHHCDFEQIISDAAEGTGLAFIVFTQAMVEFPGSPFWAVIFFLMLLSLGLGSMFGTLEGVITSIHDLRLFPWLKKPILTGILCAVGCVIGLIFVTRAGEYWVKLFDAFAGSYALLAVAFLEVVAVVYVYGWRRFCDDIEWMTGVRPGLYWTCTWRFFAPIIMFALFWSSVIVSIMEEPRYHAYNIEQAKPIATGYPPWAKYIGGFLVFIAMFPVPFVAFVRYFRIWKFEKDIPAAVKKLDSTTSTAYMLKSEQSIGILNSTTEIPRNSVENNVELTFTPAAPTKI